MTTVLWRASMRHGLRHPAQLALSLLGIALGVAVVVAIDLAIDSAQRAFALSNEAVMGRATHRVEGGPSGVPETAFVRLRLEAPDVVAAPVVEAHVRTTGPQAETLTLIGVDPFSEGPFRSHLSAPGLRGAGVLERLVTVPGAAVLDARAAARVGVEIGARLQLRIQGRVESLEVVGLIAPGDRLARASIGDLVLVDIATAQELLGRFGVVTRIDLIVPDDDEARARVRRLLVPGTRLLKAGTRTRVAEQMTGAFHLNLSMLSLLALVVGLFLIYNTMAFSVVQRWRLLGDLRTLGVTRREVARLVLAEAALLGAVAAAAGLALGVGLAQQLVGLVSQTINDLYFRVSVREVHVAPLTLAKGVALGCVAAVAAAALPAFEASRAPPGVARLRSRAESTMLRRTPALAALGAALLGVATLALLAPGRSVAAGFAALFAVVIGFALLAPAVTVLAVRALEPVHARLPGCLGALAVRGVSASLSRTSIAIAALMVALSATVGVGIMVDSFRTSVERWLGMTLRADLYLGVPGADQALDPDLVNVARALPGVAHMSSGRRVRLQATSGELRTLVIEMAPGSYAGFELVDGEPATAWPAFDASDAVLVSEPFAWRHRLGRGDTLDVLTDDGPETFAIVGVYRDYESERGRVLMSRGTFARHWDDPRVSTLGLYLEEGAEPAQVAAAAEALFSARQAVVVRANGEIKAASMAIFERTFTITAVLRVLATVVAIVGVLSALMALELERAKEVAILRAQGLTRGGLWVLVEAQTGLMGLLSGVLAIPLGLALALILVHVINRRSFGWGMSLHVEPAILVQAPLIAVAAALLAGVYPAWRMAMTTPAAGLREE